MRTSDSRPPRPTAVSMLGMTRAVGIASGVVCGVSTALGILPEAIANGGLYYAVPIVAGGALGFGVSGGWELLCRHAAHTRSGQTRSIAAGLGVALVAIAVSTSSWFTATLIGGNAALSEWRLAHVAALEAGVQGVENNATVEHDLTATIKSGAASFASYAQAETDGYISRRHGQGPVARSLMLVSGSLDAKADGLRKLEEQRTQDISDARRAMDDARKAVTANDDQGFSKSVAHAAASLSMASAIRLSAADVGQVAVVAEVKPLLDHVLQGVREIMHRIDQNRADITIPSYGRIDAKTAMIREPQLAAWLVGIAIDALPAFLLALLLAARRHEDDDPRDEDASGIRGPAAGGQNSTTLQRPALIAAE